MHHIDLDGIHLDAGSHPEDGRGCVMEWTARFAGEKVTDHPTCTSPVLTAFAIRFNDGLPDDERQRLIPFIPRLVGTAGDVEADRRRRYLAVDWAIRRNAPRWLRAAGLTDDADTLAALPEIVDATTATAARKVSEPIRQRAYARRQEAWRAAAASAAADASAAAAAAADALKGKSYTEKVAYFRAVIGAKFADELKASRDEGFDLLDRMIEVRSAVAA